MAVEPLEARQLLASLPYGAMPDDTGEYLLGDVVVTVVLMESTPTLAPHDVSTENWNPQTIQQVKDKVEASFDWWKSVLAARSPTMAADLNFYPDYTYANTPVPTGYEPINRISNDFYIPSGSGGGGWMYDFLKKVGYNQTGDFSLDLRAFNNAQRLAGTSAHPGPADWAFTIFIVNSTADGDDAFASGGSFTRAFSFPGGRMMIVPSDRPDYTFTHELGHQFWALDEYSGSNYLARRGYYNSPNANAVHANYVQQSSIMTNGDLLENAWDTQQQDDAALEMIGWRDSDGDGIFDVLDVPFALSGTGYYDSAAGKYRFQGTSEVRALPNLNSAGLGNDITINQITRAEYRIDGGPWQTAANYNAPTVTLNLAFNVPPTATTVEIRTIDAVLPAGGGGTGASSPIFLADLTKPNATVDPGINGFVWNDLDGDAKFETGEPGLPGWTVQLVDGSGQPLPLWSSYDANSYAAGTILNSANPAATLSAVGFGTDGTVLALNSALASTPGRVFGVYDTGLGSSSTTWDSTNRNLRVRFASSVNQVSLDAIGNSAGDYARLEAYDANDILLARYTTTPLSSGQVQTMTLERPTPDIAYVIAQGHAGTDVLLDNLKFGAQVTTTTGTFGEYALANLPPGTYTVRVTPPGSFAPTAPLPGTQTLTVTAGETRAHVDFAAQGINNPWQNPANQHDVDGDTQLAPIDALQIINDLNNHGARQLPSPGVGPQAPPPYLDVNGDGFVAPVDALMVINRLNAGGAPEGPDVPAGGGLAGGASPGGEGESLALTSGTIGTAPTGFELLRRFTARGRHVAAVVLDRLSSSPTTASAIAATTPIDDELALDVHRAWVKARDAAADLEGCEHDHDDDHMDLAHGDH